MKYLGKNGLRVENYKVWHEGNFDPDSKVDNSRVLTDVPANAKFTDTIYTHPSTHPASMITESTSRRFVSDAEKSSWNNKAEISDIPTKVSQLENDKNYVTQSELDNAGYGDMMKSIYDKNNDGIVDIAEDSNKLGGKPSSYYQQAIGYTPVNKAGDTVDGNLGIGGTLIVQGGMVFQAYGQNIDFNAATLNNITSLSTRGATPSFLMEIDYNGYPSRYAHGFTILARNPIGGRGADNNIGFQIVNNQDPANQYRVFSAHSDGTVKAENYQKNDGTQVAYVTDIPINLSQLNKDINFDERYYTESEVDNKLNSKAEISDIPTKVSQLENDKNYVTQEELGDAGFGDMVKAVYDKNNDGKVDKAEIADVANSVAWGNISGKPSTFPPSSHGHNCIVGDDTRNENYAPSEYMSGGSRGYGRAVIQSEFKYISTIGAGSFLKGMYCQLITYVPWTDPSGGYPIQIAYGNGNPVWRVGTSNTTWGEWQPFSESLHIGTSAPSNHNIGWVDTSL